MAKKVKPPPPFLGRWRITSMEKWDQGFVDAEVEGFVEFRPGGRGSFQFGYVSGKFRYRGTARDDKPGVEWSWKGMDEMDRKSGSGWATMDDVTIHGLIAIHLGDESAFDAIRKG